MLRLFLSICCVAAATLASCAYLTPEEPSPELTPTTANTKFEKSTAATASGDSVFKFKGKGAKAEWISCKKIGAKATVFVMHGDKAGYDKGKFCDGWIAQAFLGKNLNVITVNRPGFGGSPGPDDLAGPASISALEAGLQAALKKEQLEPVIGVWGYSSGAAAAAFVSKKIKGLKFALLGGGVYDLDEASGKSKDEYLLTEIKMIKNTYGDEALADRSILYDVTGLPTKVVIYHGKLDTSVPPEQATAFKDALTSSQVQAQVKLLDGVGHDIPWHQHRQMIETLITELTK